MMPAMKASVAFTVALMVLLLAIPIQAHLPHLPHQARRRMTASAVAVSQATATNGASVSSESKAISTGAPAVSIVNAEGSGQGTVVDCKQVAKNNETLCKECTDKQNKNKDNSSKGNATVSAAANKDSSNKGNATASASASAAANATATGGTTVPWKDAPRCSKPASAYQVKNDTNRNPWGWENNTTSCALRKENGDPLYY